MTKLVIPLTAMLCITVLEGIGLGRGCDNGILSVAIAAIAGVGGYTLRYVLNDEGGQQ